MNWNKLVRQSHRWIAVAFVLGFVANLFAQQGEEPVVWVGLLALIPLLLLMVTGIYLFALPYVAKRRNVRTP